jgi:hypothetical protein
VAIATTGCRHRLSSSRGLDAEVIPNPTSGSFTVRLLTPDAAPCSILLRDITGRIILRKDGIAPGTEVLFGEQLSAGIYLAEVRQQEERFVVRIVKNQ